MPDLGVSYWTSCQGLSADSKSLIAAETQEKLFTVSLLDFSHLRIEITAAYQALVIRNHQ